MAHHGRQLLTEVEFCLNKLLAAAIPTAAQFIHSSGQLSSSLRIFNRQQRCYNLPPGLGSANGDTSHNVACQHGKRFFGVQGNFVCLSKSSANVQDDRAAWGKSPGFDDKAHIRAYSFWNTDFFQQLKTAPPNKHAKGLGGPQNDSFFFDHWEAFIVSSTHHSG